MNTKTKFALILLALLIILLIAGLISNSIYTKTNITTIKGPGTITKVEMKISSTSGLKNIVITDTNHF